jgi:hypothetical protein
MAMRVSHQDREQIAELLRVAAGDGRLSLEELDERLERALTARTYGDLAPLLADLPGQSVDVLSTLNQQSVEAKDVVRIRRVGGSARYEGRWVVPRLIEVSVEGGNARLDFTQAIVAGPTIEVKVALRGGNLRLIVPYGYLVDTDEVETRGGSVRHRTDKHAPADIPISHRIVVSGEVVGGNVIVRHPKRPGPLRRLLGRGDQV